VLLAAKYCEATVPSPLWMARAELMTAEAFLKAGNKVDAKEHYHRYLDKAEVSAPDRRDAIAKLKKLDPDYQAP
jgi:predicted negative regulator of RcsB-dependent stress response